MSDQPTDLKGVTPESWNCVDCGVNTAPGFLNRVELEKAYEAALAAGTSVTTLTFDEHTEVYTVREKVWAAAGMESMGGCLCVGCLEKRLGRRLRPKDFRGDDFANMPGTPRLMKRRGAR